jgi:hypothetical protein
MHHPLMPHMIFIDKSNRQFGAGLEIKFLGIKRKHSAGKFLSVFMTGMHGNFLSLRNAVAAAWQRISILSHNHATGHIH